MAFVHAILIGLFTAAVFAVVGGILALLLMIPEQGDEKVFGAGIAVMFGGVVVGALLAAVVGLVLGAVCSPLLAFATYAKWLGGAVVLFAGFCALNFDLKSSEGDSAHEINGKRVEFEYELRMPQGLSWPPAREAGHSPETSLARKRGPFQFHPLDLTKTSVVDGRLVLHGERPLETSKGDHFVDFRLAKGTTVRFFLAGQRSEANLEWSDWLTGTGAANFEFRYRLRYRAEVTPVQVAAGPSYEEEKAMEFAALDPAGPLQLWIEFLRPEGPRERVQAAAAVVEKRQDELARMIGATDRWERERGLGAVRYLGQPSAAVRAAILQEGRLVVAEVGRLRKMAESEEGFYSTANAVRGRCGRSVEWKGRWTR